MRCGTELCRSLLATWTKKIADGIDRMREQGLIAGEVTPGPRAEAIVAGIYGGVVILLATGRADHLAASLDSSLESLGDRARH